MDSYTKYLMEDSKYYIQAKTASSRKVACYYGIARLLITEDDDQEKLQAIHDLCQLAETVKRVFPKTAKDAAPYDWSNYRNAQVEVVSDVKAYIEKSRDPLGAKFSNIRYRILNTEIPSWAKVGKKVRHNNEIGVVTDNSVVGTISARLPSGVTVTSGVKAFSQC